MNWYYAASGKQIGPVDGSELKRLHASGEITDGTLVWREGMSAWQSYRAVAAVLLDAPDVAGNRPEESPGRATDEAAGVGCIECGREFSRHQVVALPAGPCCAGCKARVLQKMREGIAVGPREELRRRYLTREVSIRSVGAVCCFGVALGFLDEVTRFVGAPAAGFVHGDLASFGLGMLRHAAYLAMGIGLCRLRPWGRWACLLVCADALVRGPGAGAAGLVSCLIHGYIVYLLFSPAGGAVFTPAYREAVTATPHLRWRTGPGTKIAAVLVLLLVVIGWVLASGVLLGVE